MQRWTSVRRFTFRESSSSGQNRIDSNLSCTDIRLFKEGVFMAFQTKGLWAENITDDTSLARLKQHMTDAGANLLCIRSESPYIEQLMHELQPNGVKVYVWRWPNLFPDPKAKPIDPQHPDPARDDIQYWKNELEIAKKLIAAGIDGYVFDIESDDGIHSKKNHYQPYPHDWDNPNVDDLVDQATTFASGISGAFVKRKKPYVLGLTSHQWGFSNYPKIPWKPFLDVCNALFPQTYWRADDGSAAVKDCGGVSYDYSVHPPLRIGTPDQAVFNGFKDYANKKNAKGVVLPIIPVGGEIGCTKFGEMPHFGTLVAQLGLTEVHFYVDVRKPGWIEGPPQGNDPRVLKEIEAL
jgi:hypothetical protein